jgi:predicted dehydrogenase
VLKVAIVGCGKIADSHAAQIQRISGCEIVGVCDREALMARQLYERFPIKGHYNDVGRLLAATRPDVVHITAPPANHFELARTCLEHGAHVYVEKPFTLNLGDAECLIALAQKRKLKITVGHDDQFSHVARRMRALVRSGYLGEGPLHIESCHCYDLDAGYATALLRDKQHWVRQLPGKLLHNVISHGIARIAEFLTSDRPRVIAHGFVSPRLRSIGETAIIDELRVIISDEQQTTAYFTFSSQMRPSLHQLRLYGSKNGLILDQDQESLIKLPGKRFKSYAEKFVSPVLAARQQLGNVFGNLNTFLKRDFQMKSGMKFLIESFYGSIVRGTRTPLPYGEILLTARIIDTIFEQLDAQRSCSTPL